MISSSLLTRWTDCLVKKGRKRLRISSSCCSEVCQKEMHVISSVGGNDLLILKDMFLIVHVYHRDVIPGDEKSRKLWSSPLSVLIWMGSKFSWNVLKWFEIVPFVSLQLRGIKFVSERLKKTQRNSWWMQLVLFCLFGVTRSFLLWILVPAKK